MTIDVHVHIGTFPSIEGAGAHLVSRPEVASFRTREPELYKRFTTETAEDNTDRLIQVMDANGVEISLVQPRPGVTNEFVAEVVRRHPGRLIPLALPTPWPVPGDPAAVTQEDGMANRVAENLEHCFTTLGMRAAGEIYVRRVTSSVNPEVIADDFSPMMDVLARFGAPLEIPTAWTQFPGGLFYGDPIWVDELACRYPTVPIVLTKMGRGIGRYFESSLTVALRNHNVYFDTSDTRPEHLAEALDRLGPERILFGTDWSATWQFMAVPGSVHEIAFDTLASVTNDSGILRMIQHENAQQVFSAALAV